MPRLFSLRETIEAIADCLDDRDVWDRYAWVYVDSDRTLTECRFYMSSRQDEMDCDEEAAVDDPIPPFAAQHSMQRYLEAATFADVLTVQKRQKPLSEVEEYAGALEYYAEYDAFLDLGTYADGEVAPPIGDISRELYAEYDLNLVACPRERIGDAARAVGTLLELSLPQSLALCRQLPLSLGKRIDMRECARIERRFAELQIPLERHRYRPLAWLPAKP